MEHELCGGAERFGSFHVVCSGPSRNIDRAYKDGNIAAFSKIEVIICF
jgi:hypothetical protein